MQVRNRYRARIGNGLTRPEIGRLVKEVLDKAEMDSGNILENEDRVFPNNLPNVTWIHRFVKRHDNLSARTPEHLGHQRKGVTEHALRGWFESLENLFLTEHKINARDFLTPGNSHRVFNKWRK